MAEVWYFFQMTVNGVRKALALISVYGPPDKHIQGISVNALHVCEYRGHLALRVIDVMTIVAHVGMIPFRSTPLETPAISEDERKFFVTEHLGRPTLSSEPVDWNYDEELSGDKESAEEDPPGEQDIDLYNDD